MISRVVVDGVVVVVVVVGVVVGVGVAAKKNICFTDYVNCGQKSSSPFSIFTPVKHWGERKYLSNIFS